MEAIQFTTLFELFLPQLTYAKNGKAYRLKNVTNAKITHLQNGLHLSIPNSLESFKVQIHLLVQKNSNKKKQIGEWALAHWLNALRK